MSALVLLRSFDHPAPSMTLLLAIGLAALWLSYRQGWLSLPWLSGLPVDSSSQQPG